MKRLLYLIALLASFTLLTGFGPLLKGQKVLYRGTVTGLRISAVNGTAFIDGANASITDLANGNNLIEVYDASGRMLRGFLKSQGAGETVSDLFVAWYNDAIYPYGTFTDSGTGITQAINTTGYANARPVQNGYSVSNGMLIKNSFSISLASGTMPTFRVAQYPIGHPEWGDNGLLLEAIPSEGANAYYVNTNASAAIAYSMLRNGNSVATNFSVTGYAVGQVLTPSSAGAVIVSTKGGAVENWASKNASFTYNAASYYCIVKAAR